MKNITTVAKKTYQTSDGIKVIIKSPPNVSDAVKQEKKSIYDILTKHRSA